MARFALASAIALLTLAACSLRDDPKPCEADSDCGGGMTCQRELVLLPLEVATASLKRAPREVCTPNRAKVSPKNDASPAPWGAGLTSK